MRKKKIRDDTPNMAAVVLQREFSDGRLKEQKVNDKTLAVQAIKTDLLQGMDKADIEEKFLRGGYVPINQNISKASNRRLFRDYYSTALDRIGKEFELDEKELRERFVGRYMFLYSTACNEKRWKEARNVLDSLAKFCGLMDNQILNVPPMGEVGDVNVVFQFNKDNSAT